MNKQLLKLYIPIISGILSFISICIYFYSANHAPYSWIGSILFVPIFSFIGILFTFINRKEKKNYSTLWYSGIILNILGFIFGIGIIAVLILFMSSYLI